MRPLGPEPIRRQRLAWLQQLPILAAVVAVIFLGVAGWSPREFTRSTQPFHNRVSGDLLPGRSVSQEFLATADGLDRVEVQLSATPGVTHGTVIVTLVDRQTSAEVATVTSPGSSAVDTGYQSFDFPAIAKSAGRSYRFSLASPDAAPGRAIFVNGASWGADNEGGLTIGGARQPGSLTFKTHYNSPSALASFLDQLTAHKPGLWGNRTFYVLLAITYVATLAGLLTALFHRRGTLGLIWLTSVVVCQSLVYIAIVPPWEVPDEPEHFHYIRQLWLEQQNEPSGSAEQAVLQSMARDAWYQINNMTPPDQEPAVFDDVAFLRLSGTKRGIQPSPYYQLAALAVRLSHQTDVDGQLYAVRLLSSLLSIGVVIAGYLCGRLVLSRDHALAIATIVALFPERAFVAAGANNDNLAILVASLAFLSSIYLVARGFSLPRFLVVALACAFLPLAKATALEGAVAPVVLSFHGMLSAITQRWSKRAAVGLSVVALGVLFAAVGLSLERGAYGWALAGASPGDRAEDAGPGGSFALRVRDDGLTGYGSVYQAITGETATRLAGHPVTAGAWVRAERTDQTGAMQFFDGVNWHTSSVVATSSWQFVSVSAVLDPATTELLVDLVPTSPLTRATDPLLFSGVVLVASDQSGAAPPTLLDDGQTVDWNGTKLKNLVTNGSAERPVWVWKGPLRQVVSTLGGPDPLATVQESVYAATVRRTPPAAYVNFVATFVESFWARFGWMNVVLSPALYGVLEAVTLLSLIGVVGSIARRALGQIEPNPLLSKALALSVVVVLVGFVFAMLRVVPGVDLSQGRYALPVLVPFAIVLYSGLDNWSKPLASRIYPSLLVMLFGMLNLVCLFGAIIPASYLW